MKAQLLAGAISFAVAVLSWGVTTALGWLDPVWRVVVAVGLAALVALIVVLIARRRATDPTSTRVASGIRARGGVRVSGAKVSSSRDGRSIELASDIRSGKDVDIENIESHDE
ncbi:hypothetical protein [Microbacterium aurantiacum]|uniref:hypothetical protein n=1 Tax=Microbacterium aurantiacum TaxID=162393 RepID=UPI003D728B0A